MSGYDDDDTASDAVHRGAYGFVSKHGSSTEIIEAIRTVASGEFYLKLRRA
jgi:DNA-binding NarL/FixJ family response regulator